MNHRASLPAPTPGDVREIGRRYSLDIADGDAEFYAMAIASSVGNFDVAAKLAAEADSSGPSLRRSFEMSELGENRNDGWYVRSHIQEKGTGRLAGRTVAIKDSIPVAGLPMTAGSNVFDGYVPDFDAEVVRRILREGGVVAGKAHCEYLCISGNSHTGIAGPIHNPWREGFSAGGSSSGSAVVVARGEVEMALGADQGGSIRIPSSFSGIVGIKPTYGLVPYTGIAPLDASFDHVGPMTRTVADAALLLSVIAGPDGSDARQHGMAPDNYDRALSQGVAGLRIGVLREGFSVPGSDPAVAAKVSQAAQVLGRLGAVVRDVSVPMHSQGFQIWTTIGWTGMTETVFKGNGFGISRNDFYPVSMMEWARDHADRIGGAPPSVKLFFLISEFAKRHLGYVGYGNGINAGRLLRAKYDEALRGVDLLLMPTTPMTATPLPDAATTVEQELSTSHPMALNTAPFNITHHPALSLPCGGIDGLPVGLMLVGRHYEETMIFRAARAFEETGEGRF